MHSHFKDSSAKDLAPEGDPTSEKSPLDNNVAIYAVLVVGSLLIR